MTERIWIARRQIGGERQSMQRNGASTARLAALAGITLLAVGCQAIEDERTADTEQLLQQAGFQVRSPETAGQKSHLEATAQRTFVTHERAGIVHYVYADAKGCNCIYIGTPEEYARYQTLEKQEVARASDHLNSAVEWGDAQQYWSSWQAESGMPDDAAPPDAFDQPGRMVPVE